MERWHPPMPYPRVLPDREGLSRLIRRHRRDVCSIQNCSGRKHTYLEIAEAFDVHESAVYQAMRRAGLTDEGSRIDHNDTIPWTLRPEHRYKHPAEMLRLYGRARSDDFGMPVDKRRMLIKWLRERLKANEVVAYDPATPPNPASDSGGWSYVIREDSDADLIRPPDHASPMIFSDSAERDIWSQNHLTEPERRLRIIAQRAETGTDPRDLVLKILSTLESVDHADGEKRMVREV